MKHLYGNLVSMACLSKQVFFGDWKYGFLGTNLTLFRISET